jgi:hypothetical protein
MLLQARGVGHRLYCGNSTPFSGMATSLNRVSSDEGEEKLLWLDPPL